MKPIMRDLVQHFGTQADLAIALGVSFAAVSQWVSNGAIPAKRAIQIELLTEGEFNAIDLYKGDEHDA